ncbi:hypothetical protein FBY14_1121, partial [Azospirillum brasilense]
QVLASATVVMLGILFAERQLNRRNNR